MAIATKTQKKQPYKPGKLLTPEEAAAKLRVTVKTLSNWRVAQDPTKPQFIKDKRIILYDENVLDRWLADHTVSF